MCSYRLSACATSWLPGSTATMPCIKQVTRAAYKPLAA